MLSRLNRSTCLLIMSIVLCVSLPGVQARPFTDQASIYLPMVQPRPVLLLSGPAFYEWRYGVITIGEVVNMSATQAFSVTVQAIIYDQNRGITQTQIIIPHFPVILPGQGSPFSLGAVDYEPPIIHSLSFYQVIPTSAPTIRSVSVISHTIEDDCGVDGVSLIGSVRNDNTVPVTQIMIDAWALRGNSIIGLGYAYIPGPLAPGAEQGFLSRVSPCVASADSLQYAAQGTVVISP